MKKIVNFLKLIAPLLLIVNLTFGQDTKSISAQDTTTKKCKLKYPSAARKNGIQGTVEIKVVFDSKCAIKEYKVIKSLGYGCDEAAIDCLINVQEKIKKEKQSKCEDGFEAVFPFNFKLD
jgi:TonB family protein